MNTKQQKQFNSILFLIDYYNLPIFINGKETNEEGLSELIKKVLDYDQIIKHINININKNINIILK